MGMRECRGKVQARNVNKWIIIKYSNDVYKMVNFKGFFMLEWWTETSALI